MAAVRHGAHSPRRVTPIARAQRRRFLARAGISAGQLDGITRARLDQWARLTSKLELLDRWLDANGLLGPGGEPAPCLALYVSLVNSQRLALTRLEDALRAARDAAPPVDLQAYLRALPDEDDDGGVGAAGA